MRKFSARENVILGYSPPRSFSNTTTSLPSKEHFRNSDVEFNDVFGGPLRRRSSIFERCSFSESVDFNGSTGDDEITTCPGPWSRLNQKPVFGEESVHPSNTFFHDIFKGDENETSSPRNPEHDPFSLTPRHSSLPAQFCLPPKWTKTKDVSSTTSLSRFSSSQPSQGSDHEDLTSNNGLLSREFSTSSDGSLTCTKSSNSGTETNILEDSIKSSEFQFNFSTLNWGCRGFPSLTPQNENKIQKGPEKVKIRRCSSNNGRKSPTSILRNGNDFSFDDQIILNIKSFKAGDGHEENDLFPNGSKEDRLESCHIVEEKRTLRSFELNDYVDSGRISKKREGKATALKKPEGVDHRRNRIKGKVDEFVKIFKHGGSSKNKEAADSRTGNDEKIRRQDLEKSSTFDASLKVMEFYFKKSMQEEDADYASSQQDISTSTTASVPDESSVLIDTMKELSQDENEPQQMDREDINVIDTKIQKWSEGKEGNIRSLLATLQYALWANSGWKAIPLVDIVQGNSVKRAYQKALLCLHPDKLQQKGAALHQKYSAEKIFDILQDAWMQFNSIGIDI